MASGILGSAAPSATTQTEIYTVPASKLATIYSFTVVNRDTSAGTFRVALLDGGGTVANEDYVFYDHPIDASETIAWNPGWVLAATDQVEVYASSANMTFMVTGIEEAT